MYSELNMWAKRQELQRELARLDLLSEAKEVAAEVSAAERQSRRSRVTRRARRLASAGLSPLRMLARSV